MDLPKNFAYQKPRGRPASIKDLFTFKVNPVTHPNRPGWELAMDVNVSYHNGLLAQQYSPESNKEQVDKFFRDFFTVDQDELARFPVDVQNFVVGWRTYYVRLSQDTVTGGHFHRLKKEILTVVDGELMIKFEDIYGNKKEQRLNKYNGTITLPFISHEIVGIAPNSILKVIANTAYDPNDQRTQDTWISQGKEKNFLQLQKENLRQNSE